MDLAIILVPIFAFVLIRGALDQRARTEERRLKVLEQALQSGQLDRRALEAFTQQVTGKAPPSEHKHSRMLSLLLALGWVTLFTGLGIIVLGQATTNSDLRASGALVAVIGFGVVTYPFALRELHARRAAQ